MSQQDVETADAVRQRLYDTTDAEDDDIESYAARLLSIGREYLGVENGHIERVDGPETHTVVASVGEGEEAIVGIGDRLEAAKTFCRHTIERDTSLAIADATEDGFAEDPAHLEHGLQCYLGASLVVDGETYGTVCFIDPDPAAERFSPSERSVVELIARLLERRIEREDFERRLDRREEALARSEHKYETLLEAAPGAIFLVDDQSATIVEANDAATSLTGRSRRELEGTSVFELHPAEHREQYRQLFDRVGDTDAWVDRFPDDTPLRIRQPDGLDVPVEIGAERVQLDGQPFVQAIVRDISDQRRRECRLHALHEASRELLSAPDRTAVADIAVDAARDVLGYDLNGVHLLDDDGGLAPVAVTDAARAVFDRIPTFGGDDSIAWEVYETGEATMTDDVTAEPGVLNSSSLVQSELILPLGDHGVFVIASQSASAFTEANTSLASVLATTVEAALDQVKRKQALRRSRNLLQRTEELADTGGWTLDAATEEIRWTTGTRRLFEVEAEFEPTLQETLAFFESEDSARLEDVSQRCLDAGVAFDEELQIETAAGTEKWVRVRGEPLREDDAIVGISGAIQDITERRERERDLRVKTRAIDEASIGITIADATAEDLPLVYANREFERITGRDREAVCGQNCRFLQGPATAAASTEALGEAIEQREPITLDLLNYRADGTPFWNELTVTPVTDDCGSLTHYVGFQQDITARKRREQLISVLNRVLRHNLRNDMTVIKGNAEVVASRADGTVADVATDIVETAQELSALSEKAQTLESAMRSTDTPAPRDVVADVEAAVEALPTDTSTVDCTIEAPASQQAIGTEQLQLALQELGQNAIQYGGDEPSITYRVTESDSKAVAIEVVDDGPGLDPVEQEVLRTGHESPLTHGSGLGLWLVNWIATSVGGTVTTAVSEGTTVTIHLPAPGDEEETTDQSPQYWQSAFVGMGSDRD